MTHLAGSLPLTVTNEPTTETCALHRLAECAVLHAAFPISYPAEEQQIELPNDRCYKFLADFLYPHQLLR
jgi:hypothetical protein